MRRVFILALASATALAATPASASLVYNANLSVSSQGFGNVPRDLTLQGSESTEGGCIGVTGAGAISFGSCVSDASVHNGNGVTNTSSTADLPNPQADDQKYGIPTVAELGWTTAADIGLLFNAVEPSGNSITVNDITLKFYTLVGNTWTFLTAIDGPIVGGIEVPLTFDPSQPGNGSAGFVFVVDQDQQNFLNATIFNVLANLGGAGNVRIALESTVSNAAAGPESWTAINLRNPPSVPEPATWAMMLLGFGGIGMAMRRSRRRTGALLQIA